MAATIEATFRRCSRTEVIVYEGSKYSMQLRITDDLAALVNVLPPYLRDELQRANRGEDLIEVVLDLGRRPEARFTEGELTLNETEISRDDIDLVLLL